MKNIGHLPSLENLLCFLAAAEQLNFARAAKQRNITPAAFGQRIKQLEQELGCSLFVRLVRSVELTPEGHQLLPVAQSTIREALLCREVVHCVQTQPIHLTLGTRFELGMSWVIPSILAFQREHPRYLINFYFGSGSDLLEKLKQREVDAIITSAPQSHEAWISEFLHGESYVFVGATSLLQQQPFHSPQDAIHHWLLDIDETLPLTRYLTSASGNLPFSQFRQCGTGAAIYYLVQQGQGVAVLPEYMVVSDLRQGILQRILPQIPLLSDSFRLLYDRRSLYPGHMKTLAEFLRTRPLS